MKRMIIVGWALLGSLGCEASKLQLCDITAADCQESIYLGNVRVRGDGYDPFQGVPPIRTIGEEQFRAEMKAEAEQAAQNPAAQQPWWDSALALLHLMPSATEVEQDAIDNRVEQVAAYYDPSTRKVTVIDHQQPQTDSTRLGNMITLAHELLHAIQDRELDLDINPKTTDELFANKALIEGDATTYELLFALELEPRIKQVYPDPLSYANKLRSMFMADGPKLADDSDETNFASLGPPYMAAMYLVYPLGGIWVGEHYKQGGNSAVRHAYGKAPMRSLEYLLPMGNHRAVRRDHPLRAQLSQQPRLRCSRQGHAGGGAALRLPDGLGREERRRRGRRFPVARRRHLRCLQREHTEDRGRLADRAGATHFGRDRGSDHHVRWPAGGAGGKHPADDGLG
jgi:hypothetical protein